MKLIESLIQIIKEQDVKSLKGEMRTKIKNLKEAKKEQLKEDKKLNDLKKQYVDLRTKFLDTRREIDKEVLKTLDIKTSKSKHQENLEWWKKDGPILKEKIRDRTKVIKDSYETRILQVKDEYNEKIKLAKKNKKNLKEQSKKCNVGNNCTVALDCKGTSSYHGTITSECECSTANGTYSSGWRECPTKGTPTKEVSKEEVQSAVDAFNAFIYGQLLHATNYTQEKMKENLLNQGAYIMGKCPEMLSVMEESNKEMPYVLIKYEDLDGFHEVIMNWKRQGNNMETLDRLPIHVNDCDFVKNVSETKFEDKIKEINILVDEQNEEIRKKNEANAQEDNKPDSPPAYDPR